MVSDGIEYFDQMNLLFQVRMHIVGLVVVEFALLQLLELRGCC